MRLPLLFSVSCLYIVTTNQYKNKFVSALSIILASAFTNTLPAQNLQELVRSAFHNDSKKTIIQDRLEPLANYYHLSQEGITDGRSMMQALGKKSIQMRGEHPDSVLYYAQQIIVFSQTINYVEGMQKGNHLVGKTYMMVGDFLQAEKFANTAILLAQQMKSSFTEAASLDLKGAILRQKGAFEEAIQCHEQAAELSRKANDAESEAIALSNIAVALDSKGSYREAMEMYLKSLKVIENTADTAFTANILMDIGALHLDNGYHDKAVSYFEQALHLHTAIGSAEGVCQCLNNLGVCYSAEKKYEQAITYFKQSELLAQKNEDKYMLATNYSAMEKAYRHLNQLQTAEEYLSKAMKLFQEMDAKTDLAELHLAKAENAIASQDWQTALLAAKTALSLGDSTNSAPIKVKALEGLSVIFDKLGQPDKALDYFKQATILQDSIKGFEIIKSVHELEIAYQTEKKERLISAQQAQIVQHRLISGLIGMFFLAAFIFAVAATKSKKQQSDINALLNAQKEQLIADNKKLKEQLDNTPTPPLTMEYACTLTFTLGGQDKTVLRLCDVLYIKSNGNLAAIHTRDGKIHYDWQRLHHFTSLLEPSGFFYQIHRSYLINFLHVKARKASELVMADGSVVKIGSTRTEVDRWLDERIGQVAPVDAV